MQHPGGVQEVVAVLTERKGHFAERLSSLMHQWDEGGERIEDDFKIQLCNYGGDAAIIGNEGIVSGLGFGEVKCCS